MIKNAGNSKVIRRARGFNLLELMLAIAVIAAMAIYATSALQNWIRNEDASITAVKMQRLLGVGIEYHNQRKVWPASIDDLINVGFLQPGAECAPWSFAAAYPSACPSGWSAEMCHFYSAALPRSRNCPNKAIFRIATASASSSNPYLVVSLTVPSPAVASKISAQLPSGAVYGNTIMGYTTGHYIPPVPHRRGWFAGAGLTGTIPVDAPPTLPRSVGSKNPGNKPLAGAMILPKCPAGYEGHVITTPQYFSTDYNNAPLGLSHLNDYVILGYPGREAIKNASGNYVAAPRTEPAPKFPLGAGAYFQYRTFKEFLQTFYFTFCLPEGQWGIDSGSRGKVKAQCVNTKNGNATWWGKRDRNVE